jgi:phage terminase large subunit
MTIRGTALNLPTPRWAKPLTAKRANYRAAYGGRSSGKSWFFSENLVERCVVRKTDCVCIREVQKDLRHSMKRTIETIIDRENLSRLFRVLNNEIHTHNGGIIIFQGMQHYNSESIKSLEGFDIGIVEESQNLSQTSLDLLRPTIRRKENSELWFIWNPRFPTDPVDNFFRSEAPPPGTILVNCNYWDNPWLPKASREEMLYDRKRDWDKYLHVWCGQYIQNSEAKVFKNWKTEDFDTPNDAMFHFGADWGFANDPTVLVRCFVIGRKLYIDYEAWQVGCEILDTPDLFGTIPESDEWPIIADSARPETISHLNKNGFKKIYAAKKGKESVKEGIEFLKSYDIIIHPRCRHAIDEFQHYSYKVDKDTDKVLPVIDDKCEDHVIDSLRYALEGQMRAARNKRKTNVTPIKTKSYF